MGEVEHPDHDHRGAHQRQQQRRLSLHESGQHKGHQHDVGADQPDQGPQAAPARHGDHDDGVEDGQEDDGQRPDEVDEDVGRARPGPRRRPGPWRGSGSGCCPRRFTPWDLATSGLMTTLTGLPPLSGSVKAKVHSEPCLRRLAGGVPPARRLGAVGRMQLPVTTRWILPVSNVTPGRRRIGAGQRDALLAARRPQQRHRRERQQRQRDQDGRQDPVGLFPGGERLGRRLRDVRAGPCECPAPISCSTSCRKLYGVGGCPAGRMTEHAGHAAVPGGPVETAPAVQDLRGRLRGRDVLVDVEEVLRIVLGFDLAQPRVVRPVVLRDSGWSSPSMKLM